MATDNIQRTRVYTPLQHYSTRTEVEECLQYGSWECLMRLPLALGQSFPDWRYAESVCLRLAKHDDPAVRVNACRGFGYLARTRKRLRKSRVQPIICKEYRSHQRSTREKSAEYRALLEDTLGTIRFHQNWCIGKRRYSDKNYERRLYLADLRRRKLL